MSALTFAQIISGLQKGLDTVDALLPLTVIGGPAAVAVGAVISPLIDLGLAALEMTSAGYVVATSDDQAEIRRLILELQGRNDVLAQRIAES